MKLISDRDLIEREKLSDVIPLHTPLSLFIEPARTCNFKCKYCYHSFTKEKLEGLNFKTKGLMDFDLYIRIIDDIKKFPNRIKTIHLMSAGEALLNEKLPEMIEYAKQKNVTERINLVTNGSVLTPELNIKLIDSGLDTIKISIQGTSEESYKEVSNVKINIERLVKNIKHFYENRKNCKLYIKIGDISIKNNTDKLKFYNMFCDMCDGIFIEHIYDIDSNLSLNLNKEKDKNIYNIPITNISICSMPFYMLNISFDGNVRPCCHYLMESFGNISSTSIIDIWNGKKLKEFRHSLLQNELRTVINKNQNECCNNCNIPPYTLDEKDKIDKYAWKLIKYFK